MSFLASFRIGILHISKCKFSTISPKIIKLCAGKNKSFLVPYVWKSTGQETLPCTDHTKNVRHRGEDVTYYETFDKMMESRRDQAQRSILVQVQSEQSCTELHKYCSQYGHVEALYHYLLPESLHFILVEFTSKEDVSHILSASAHSNRAQVVPVRSPFLWFRTRDKSKPTELLQPAGTVPLVETYGNAVCDDNALRERLLAADSFSSQLRELHSACRLPELGVRLRFLTARQAELALAGLFPRAQALPFGSTVNGFGGRGCDLDLVLSLDTEDEQVDGSSRLVFHAKGASANGRTQTQRQMEAVGDICQLFLPGCSNVRRILHARVPIVKYRQDLTDVDCDLSMTNMCAVHMSELLHLLGMLDERTQPLVFAVRRWARQAGLTNPTPGRWITNFGLTLLVLFYLQQRGVLPSLDALAELARPEDRRVTSEGVNCTFLRSAAKFHHMSPQLPVPDNLETLLLGFFEFFSSFDFAGRAISLNAGRSLAKPEHAALYVANPLERALNVTMNVSAEEAERLRIELRTAAWSCETRSGTKDAVWGLLGLLDDAGKASRGAAVRPPPKTSVRLMEVRELFGADEDQSLVPVRAKTSKAEPRRKAADHARLEQGFVHIGKQRSSKARRKR